MQWLQMIAQVGLAASAANCKFARQEVKYMGHILSSGKQAPGPERVLAVRISRPRNKRELGSFLGLCNDYRDYVLTLVFLLMDLTGRLLPLETRR